MAFLLSKKKEHLIELAEERKEEKLRREQREYEEKLRREQREYEEKLRREEREYELEKLRIQAEKNANTMNNPENVQAPKVIHETFHKFNMKDDISFEPDII
ncbi:hypothetical protein TNCV_1359281 [Trichonephila clavipes]|nr:hypothetical protein TNCV_1359281 [Trichonephila clavipes]